MFCMLRRRSSTLSQDPILRIITVRLPAARARARQTYHRTRTGPLGETICAENNMAFDASVSEIPQAAKPDF
jgi:hypothetical protein